jgi:phospholipid-binding lipoprotein MlaA
MSLAKSGRALRRIAGALCLGVVLAGCASAGRNPVDPLEPVNRAVFRFNDAVDEAVLQPVARGYRAVLPAPVRTGVGNFFSNLGDVWIGVNNILQGKVGEGIQDFGRFAFNTTFGLLGVMDIATDIDMPKHNEDFGQTLGRWGVGAGPYLVLPLLGPSTLRDGASLLVDRHGDYIVNLENVRVRNSLYVNRAVDTRANLLDAGRVLDEASLDKYRFFRDAYLQRRRSLVYDGSPPLEDMDAEPQQK